MKLSKTTWVWIIVIAIILIIAAIVIYLFRCDIFKNLTSCVEDPNKTNTPTPPGSPSPKWVAETPPYNLGMWGPKIKALQAILGFTGTALDGKLGPMTRDAIIAKEYAFPLSQADYDKITGTTTTGTGTGSGTPPVDPGNVVGKKVYAKDSIVHIRSTPDVNDGWFNNKVCELGLNHEPAPTILEVRDCSKPGCFRPNNYFWYKIQFEIENCSAKTGWVRQDVVTVK